MARVDRGSLELISDTNEGGVSMMALGGLGEIGMNCMAIECDGEILVIDCGVTFPDDSSYGVDLITPSFAYLAKHADRVVGLIVTHGHEDHIGAVPYLLREVNPPIYGQPLALAMLTRKLKEHRLYDSAELNEVSCRKPFSIGTFEIELIHVNHSIPQAASVAIRTPVGLLLHTADFKVDYTPSEEDPIDLARFAALGDEGVLALLADSTNATREGFAGSEGALAKNLKVIIEAVPGRAIVTMFSSNISRIRAFLEIAHSLGRRVLLLGRSLIQNVEVARNLGLLKLPHNDLLIERSQINALEPNEVMVLMTGSQGEPRSALTRIAMDDHQWFKILPGDRVIFSSRVIPGNERPVSKVINHLHRRGAIVIREPKHHVHVSGHASREELKLMLSLVRPQFFVPVHGEYRHLHQHAELAKAVGVEHTFVIENGDVVTFWDDEAEASGKIRTGRLLVSGKGVESMPSLAIRDRRKIAQNGLVVAWVVLNISTGELVAGPELLTHGTLTDDEDGVAAEATQSARAAVESLNQESRCESAEVAEAVRLAVRRTFNKHLQRKPFVVPIVHEL